MNSSEQIARLKSGVDAWNLWREQNPNARIDLAGANLQGANLQGADLQGADLRETDLRETNLRGAILYRANLYRATLQKADLSGAKLQGASLYRANLERAKPKGARYDNGTIWPEGFSPPDNAINTDEPPKPEAPDDEQPEDDDAPPEEHPEQGPQPEPAPQPAPSPTPGASRVTKQFVTARITYIRQEISSAQAQLKAVNDNFLSTRPATNMREHLDFHDGVTKIAEAVASILTKREMSLKATESSDKSPEEQLAELKKENAALRERIRELEKQSTSLVRIYLEALAKSAGEKTPGGIVKVGLSIFGLTKLESILSALKDFLD